MDDKSMDVPDRELNDAHFLVVGRTNADRHHMVIYSAHKTETQAVKSAMQTAEHLVGAPIWVFSLKHSFRGVVTVEGEPA